MTHAECVATPPRLFHRSQLRRQIAQQTGAAGAEMREASAILEGRAHHRMRLVQPQTNPRQERHELVLDADDLAVAFVPDAGPPLLPLGHVTFGLLLGAGAGLATWFALRASIREVRDARSILRRLAAERRQIRASNPGDAAATPWQIKQARMAEAMLLQNNADKWEQRTRAVFSGGVIGLGSAAEIYGYIASPYLFGGLSAAVATSSVIALTAGVPLISLFAGANACMQFSRSFRAFRNRRFIPMLAAQDPWPNERFDAGKAVRRRLRQIRHHAAITGLGFTGIAVGLPLSFWGGGYGLALLAPGIVTVAATNRYESRKIEYQNPMTLQAMQNLVLEREILNEMGLAWQDHAHLKQLKNNRRSHYLIGSHRGPIAKLLTKPLRGAQRAWGHSRDSGESSRTTMQRYLTDRLDVLDQYWENKIAVFGRYQHEQDPHVERLLTDARQSLRHVQFEQQRWRLNSHTARPLDEAVRLCNAIVDEGLFDEFALKVGRNADLCASLGIAQRGKTRLTTADLLKRACPSQPNAKQWTEKLFEIAEDVFLTTFKDWRSSRSNELADLAVARKRAKFLLKKR